MQTAILIGSVVYIFDKAAYNKVCNEVIEYIDI